MAQHLKLLFYDYVEDIVERRAPFRPAHLGLIEEWVADGRAVAGGATGDPPSGALIIFRETGDPEEWVRIDPYVTEGLVTSWRVESWLNVTGDL
jgi:hypothetical protein